MAKTGLGVFGSLVTDGSNRAIQVASKIQTADNTGTPQTSPLSLTTTAVFTLVVPDNAIQVTLLCGADIRVSEVVGMAQYDLIKANTKEIIPVSRMANIYVRNDATGTNNLNFKFTLV